MANLLEYTRTSDMYRQVFVPDKRNNVVTIPSQLYGRAIEIIILPAFTTMQEKQARRNWAISAQQMHAAGDDKLLISTELKEENNDWWQWEE